MTTEFAKKIQAAYDETMKPLESKRDKLQAELNAVVEEIHNVKEQMVDGLGSLGLITTSKQKTVTKPKAGAGSRKPTASPEQVAAIAVDFLTQNGPAPKDDVMAWTKEKIEEQGLGLTGFSNRFPKVIAEDPRFVEKGDKVELAK